MTSDTVRATFLTQLTDLDAELPILLLATDEGELDDCPEGLRQLFHEDDDEVFRTPLATAEERVKFFRPLRQKCLRPPVVRKAPKCASEILPLAPPPPPRQLSEVEKERLEKKEEATLRELRIFLREILAKMARNKLFYMFTRPVDVEEVPDYREVIKQPMDLETMVTTTFNKVCFHSLVFYKRVLRTSILMARLTHNTFYVLSSDDENRFACIRVC